MKMSRQETNSGRKFLGANFHLPFCPRLLCSRAKFLQNTLMHRLTPIITLTYGHERGYVSTHSLSVPATSPSIG